MAEQLGSYQTYKLLELMYLAHRWTYDNHRPSVEYIQQEFAEYQQNYGQLDSISELLKDIETNGDFYVGLNLNSFWQEALKVLASVAIE